MAIQPLMTKCEIRVRRIHANRLNFNELSKSKLGNSFEVKNCLLTPISLQDMTAKQAFICLSPSTKLI